MTKRKRLRNFLIMTVLILLLRSTYDYTILPGALFLADAALFSLLFSMAFRSGLEESIVTSIIMLIYSNRVINNVEGYMMPVYICVYALTLAVVFWMKGFKWYITLPVVALTYAAALVVGTSIAYSLLAKFTPYYEALKNAAASQVRSLPPPLIGLALATAHNELAKRRERAAADG